MSSEARPRFAGRRPFGAIPCRALTLSLAVVAVAALAACGKQGPPLPPFRVVPAPTKDLAARQQGGQILLTFGYPQASASGTALGGITKVELYEATRPVAGDKVEPLDARLFTSMAKVRLTLEGPDLVSATSGDRLNIALPLPTAAAGTTLPASCFAVKTTGKEGNASEYSNVVSLLPKAPPAAPERVVVTARADGIQVEWSAVEGAAAGYNVYRRAASARAAGQPLHQASGLERSWLDTSAKFGESYIYAVTAVSQREPILESPVTSEREVRYTDRFAPDSPKELVALAEPKQVRLVWRGSDATDVAGYLVFRRIGDQGAFQKLSPQLLPSPEMIDGDVTGGRSYTYRVVAVDQAGNESEPSAEARATIP
jgi:predicted small lipoprotein YifL